MNKKIVLTILLVIFVMMNTFVYADDEDEEIEEVVLEKEIFQEVSTNIDKDPILNSRAAVIYDRTTKKVIWGKNEKDKRAMASTTNIVTAKEILLNLLDIKAIQRLKVNL